jgi:hypothetical protein
LEKVIAGVVFRDSPGETALFFPWAVNVILEGSESIGLPPNAR